MYRMMSPQSNSVPYWSSAGSVSADDDEWLTYSLLAPVCYVAYVELGAFALRVIANSWVR